MNLLNQLTIQNLKLNKKRTIVTIIGIILSVALITAVSSIYSSAIKSLIKYETREKGNFHVAYYNVPINDLNVLKNNRAIENLYLTQNIGYAKLENSKNKEKPYAYVKAFTTESLENLSIKLVEGRLPEKDNEIIIPTHLKTNGRINYKVGDSVTLKVGTRIDQDKNILNQKNPYYSEKSNEKIVSTQTITYKIVGIIERPATNIEKYEAPGYTFITYISEKDLLGNVDVYARYTKVGTKNNLKVTSNILGINEELFRLGHSEDISEKELKKVIEEEQKAKYEYNENTYLISLETNPISNSTTGELGIVVGIVCGIIVITSVFCIKNSFDISITEKVKLYGMLRSVGATKKQIKKNVFYEATILGLIGIPLGILGGLLASLVLVIISNYFLLNSLQEGVFLVFSFSLTAIIVSVCLGIITIYLSAIRSARKAAKISPIESIKNSANIKTKNKHLKKSKIVYQLFGIGGDISYKNLKRNKKKYRTTVISIIVSVFVFIALYSFMNLAFLQVKEELNMTDYNIFLSINNVDKDILNKAIETTKLEGIRNYTLYRSSYFQIKNPKYSRKYATLMKMDMKENTNEEITISVIGKEQYQKYIKSLGLNYNEIKDKGILCDNIKINIYNQEKKKNEEYREREYSYVKGDMIEGSINNKKEIKFVIGYVTDKLPFGLTNKEYNSTIIVSDEYFDMHISDDNLIVYYDAVDASKLQDDIDEILKDTSYSINNKEENAKIMNNLFILIGIFLYGFIIVISLIGITNIFNTITTNMELRKQEFAMLKSIGMTKKEFNKMIRLESIFMGLKSLLFGVPIGIILSYVIHYFLAGATLKYELPINAIIISIFAVFLLITCIMKYSMNRINKQNTIETIRNENI